MIPDHLEHEIVRGQLNTIHHKPRSREHARSCRWKCSNAAATRNIAPSFLLGAAQYRVQLVDGLAGMNDRNNVIAALTTGRST